MYTLRMKNAEMNQLWGEHMLVVRMEVVDLVGQLVDHHLTQLWGDQRVLQLG